MGYLPSSIWQVSETSTSNEGLGRAFTPLRQGGLFVTYKRSRSGRCHAERKSGLQRGHRSAIAESNARPIQVEISDPGDQPRCDSSLFLVVRGLDPYRPEASSFGSDIGAGLNNPNLGVWIALWVPMVVNFLRKPGNQDIGTI